MIISKVRNGVQLVSIIVRRELRKVRKQDIIFVVGDSHTLLFKSPIFQIIYIGPATAFRLGEKNSTNNSNNKIKSFLDGLSKRKNHKVMFVVGEIDCRIHINKAAVKNKQNIKYVIQNTADKYIQAIETLQKEYPNIEPIVFNILPTGEQKNYYNVENYVDREKRMEITQKMNNELSNLCKKRRIKYVDIFDKLVTPNGKRIQEYVFDEVHYNTLIVPIITDELKNNSIITK